MGMELPDLTGQTEMPGSGNCFEDAAAFDVYCRFGWRVVEVDHGKSVALVEGDPETTALIAAIREEGYEAEATGPE